ncbi:MAG: LacI family DNA-binding transcriptional regulator [Anaerocolumna sp.]
MSDKAITVYDIAKEAGVSPATVSRVLTNNARVSDEKKKRILELIEKYEFEPNGLARSLSKQETKTIGMIVPDIRNPYYSTLCVECEVEAAKFGYNMILCNTMNQLEAESIHLKNLSEKHVDAIIQVGGSVDEVHPNPDYVALLNKVSKKIPIIVCGELEGANCYRVKAEDTHGMKHLIPYLLELGHREFGLVGGYDRVIPTIRKRRALKEALGELHIPIEDMYIVDGDYSIEGGYEGIKKLYEGGKLPSVIIAINEFSALGILRFLQEKDISVPKDISLVAFDDTYFSEVLTPGLTSINYNLKSFSENIIETIIDVLGKKETQTVKCVETYLTLRNSCVTVTK